MFFFSHQTKTKPVLFGKQFVKECPKCHKQAKFVECDLVEGFTAYGVIKLYEGNRRVMRCEECEQVFRLDEVTDPKEDEAKRKQQEAEEARLKAEQRAREEKEEQERQQRKKAKDAAVDKELEELKKQLGQ